MHTLHYSSLFHVLECLQVSLTIKLLPWTYRKMDIHFTTSTWQEFFIIDMESIFHKWMERVSPRQIPKEDIIQPSMYAKQSSNRCILKQYKLGNLLYNQMLIFRYKLNSSYKTLACGVNKNKLVIKSNLNHCLVVHNWMEIPSPNKCPSRKSSIL